MMLALFAVGVGVGSIARRAAAARRGQRALRAGRGSRDGVSSPWICTRPALVARRSPNLRPCRVFLRSAGELAHSRAIWSASRWRAASSPCRSTRSCSTKASRRIARASSPPTTSSTRSRWRSPRSGLRRSWREGVTMGELFALCGLLTIPVALVAAWILRRDDGEEPRPRRSSGSSTA